MEALLLVVEHNRATSCARIGVMPALLHHVDESSNHQGKRHIGEAKAGAGSMIENAHS